MELWSALLGAAVGGLIAGAVAWLQTRASIKHEFDLFRRGLEADREAGRTAFRRAAASEALAAIAVLDAAMPHMDHRFVAYRQDSPGYLVERRAKAERAMSELRRVEVSALPSLGDAFQQGWRDLVETASAASHAGEQMGDAAFTEAAEALEIKASAMHEALVKVTTDA